MFNRFQKANGFISYWPVIAAVVLGLAVALFAATRLTHYASTHVEMESVPVMSREVGPYTVLQQGDIVMKQAVKGSRQPGTIFNPAEAVGKITTSPIYQGEQIQKQRLADASSIRDKQVVSVCVDLARSVGGALRAGDIVDAWWIPGEGNTQTPGIGWVLVAANAAVIDLKDSNGRSLLAAGGNGNMMQQAIEGSSATGPPAVAVLAVSAGDVSRVIGGAVPKSQSIALAKKFNNEAAQPVSQGGDQNVQQ